jgi:hypothetical protein
MGLVRAFDPVGSALVCTDVQYVRLCVALSLSLKWFMLAADGFHRARYTSPKPPDRCK